MHSNPAEFLLSVHRLFLQVFSSKSTYKMSDGDLNTIFNSFCAFGAGGKDAQATMDNAKFGKLFRDLKLYDKKFTSTDTDIIFNRPEVKRY